MNIFEHMKKNDNSTRETNYIFHNTENIGESGVLTKQAYWTHNNPWDLENDSDFDGISDALDYHVGPGAFED